MDFELAAFGVANPESRITGPEYGAVDPESKYSLFPQLNGEGNGLNAMLLPTSSLTDSIPRNCRFT